MKRKNDAPDKINRKAYDVVSIPHCRSRSTRNHQRLRGNQKVKEEVTRKQNQQSSSKVLGSRGTQNQDLQAKITSKLQTLFEGFVSEFKSIPQNTRAGVKRLLINNKYQPNTAFGTFVNSSKKNSNGNFTASLAVQKFVNSAKSRISELLNKERLQVSSHNSATKHPKSSFVDPLEIQISLKLQSLLCQALDNKRLGNIKQEKTSAQIDITETEWQHFSSDLLHDCINSAKRKLPDSLSRELKADSKVPKLTLNKGTLYDSLATTSTYETDSILNMDCINNTRLSASSSLSIKMESDSTSESGCSDQEEGMSLNIYERNTGIILLGECEKTPDYLDLGIDSDVDDPSTEDSPPDSEEEVVLLGEKRPTYQEITLEEDDSGKVVESVVEKEKKLQEEKDLEEFLFNCPHCDKSFRVESLLKFHIRMHGAATVSTPEPSSPDSSLSSRDNSTPEKPSRSNQSCLKKEKENRGKSIEKAPMDKHRVHRKKHGRKKVKAAS